MKTRLNTTVLMMFASLLFIVSPLVSCDSSDSDEITSETKTPKKVLTEEAADETLAELMSRCLLAAAAPDAKCNDADKIYELLETLASQPTTRGPWSQAKAAIDFVKVMKDANTLHRVVIIGSMAKKGLTNRASREKIYSDIMKSKSADLPQKVKNLSCDDFWKRYSNGDLDFYAKEIYKAVIDELVTSESSATADLADYLVDNRKRPIDLTLQVAGPLIEAGANLVFAFGDDMIQAGKTAYDFVNDNGTFLLQACQGNLTAESLANACNTNLKLLSKGLEEIFPNQQDLFEVMSDATTEQVKKLNEEINKALEEAGNCRLTSREVAFFVDKVKDILKIDWKVDFVGLEFVNSSDSSVISFEKEEGKAYTFYYQDRHENVLLEGKCAIHPDEIVLRVDYVADKCDLMPKKGATSGMLFIPYTAISYSGNGTETIFMWWKSDEMSSKSFDLKQEKPSVDIKLLHLTGTAYMDDDFRCTIGSNYAQSGNGAWMLDPDYNDFWKSHVCSEQSVVKTGNVLKIKATASYRSGRADASGYVCVHESTIDLQMEYDETQKSKVKKFGKIIYLSYEATNDFSQSKSESDRKQAKEFISLAAENLPVKNSSSWASNTWTLNLKNGEKPNYWTFKKGEEMHFYKADERNSLTLSIDFR
jgi:hypothetical protein